MSENVDSKPEAQYLKSEDIGLVIAKGMAVTYKSNPENPVDFFAKWLLNQSYQSRQQLISEEKDIKRKETKDKHGHDLKLLEKEKKVEEKKAQEKTTKIREFNDKVQDSHDLEDELPSLVEHLMDFTGSTALYIGKIVKPFKKIKEDADDTAHIDEDAQSHVRFTHASVGHKFMVDKILKQE